MRLLDQLIASDEQLKNMTQTLEIERHLMLESRRNLHGQPDAGYFSVKILDVLNKLIDQGEQLTGVAHTLEQKHIKYFNFNNHQLLEPTSIIS